MQMGLRELLLYSGAFAGMKGRRKWVSRVSICSSCRRLVSAHQPWRWNWEKGLLIKLDSLARFGSLSHKRSCSAGMKVDVGM